MIRSVHLCPQVLEIPAAGEPMHSENPTAQDGVEVGHAIIQPGHSLHAFAIEEGSEGVEAAHKVADFQGGRVVQEVFCPCAVVAIELIVVHVREVDALQEDRQAQQRIYALGAARQTGGACAWRGC